jgi:hypothetical protein
MPSPASGAHHGGFEGESRKRERRLVTRHGGGQQGRTLGSGVPLALQWCHRRQRGLRRGSTRKDPRRCSRNIAVVFQWCLSGVTVVSEEVSLVSGDGSLGREEGVNKEGP